MPDISPSPKSVGSAEASTSIHPSKGPPLSTQRVPSGSSLPSQTTNFPWPNASSRSDKTSTVLLGLLTSAAVVIALLSAGLVWARARHKRQAIRTSEPRIPEGGQVPVGEPVSQGRQQTPFDMMRRLSESVSLVSRAAAQRLTFRADINNHLSEDSHLQIEAVEIAPSSTNSSTGNIPVGMLSAEIPPRSPTLLSLDLVSLDPSLPGNPALPVPPSSEPAYSLTSVIELYAGMPDTRDLQLRRAAYPVLHSESTSENGTIRAIPVGPLNAPDRSHSQTESAQAGSDKERISTCQIGKPGRGRTGVQNSGSLAPPAESPTDRGMREWRFLMEREPRSFDLFPYPGTERFTSPGSFMQPAEPLRHDVGSTVDRIEDIRGVEGAVNTPSPVANSCTMEPFLSSEAERQERHSVGSFPMNAVKQPINTDSNTHFYPRPLFIRKVSSTPLPAIFSHLTASGSACGMSDEYDGESHVGNNFRLSEAGQNLADGPAGKADSRGWNDQRSTTTAVTCSHQSSSRYSETLNPTNHWKRTSDSNCVSDSYSQHRWGRYLESFNPEAVGAKDEGGRNSQGQASLPLEAMSPGRSSQDRQTLTAHESTPIQRHSSDTVSLGHVDLRNRSVLNLGLIGDEGRSGPQNNEDTSELGVTSHCKFALDLRERSSIRDTVLGRYVGAIKAAERQHIANSEQVTPPGGTRNFYDLPVPQAEGNSEAKEGDGNVLPVIEPRKRTFQDWLRSANRSLW